MPMADPYVGSSRVFPRREQGPPWNTSITGRHCTSDTDAAECASCHGAGRSASSARPELGLREHPIRPPIRGVLTQGARRCVHPVGLTASGLDSAPRALVVRGDCTGIGGLGCGHQGRRTLDRRTSLTFLSP